MHALSSVGATEDRPAACGTHGDGVSMPVQSWLRVTACRTVPAKKEKENGLCSVPYSVPSRLSGLLLLPSRRFVPSPAAGVIPSPSVSVPCSDLQVCLAFPTLFFSSSWTAPRPPRFLEFCYVRPPWLVPLINLLLPYFFLPIVGNALFHCTI